MLEKPSYRKAWPRDKLVDPSSSHLNGREYMIKMYENYIKFNHPLLKETRINLGLSIVEIAQALGITNEAYRDIEAYPEEFFTSISFETACRLCLILGLTFDDLIYESQPVQESYYSDPLQELARRLCAAEISEDQLSDKLNLTIDAIKNLRYKIDYCFKLRLEDVVLLVQMCSCQLKNILAIGLKSFNK